MKKSFFVILLLSCSVHLLAQYYSTGADPARLKWRQIKTPYVRLVFEKGFENEALRLAYLYDTIAPLVSGTMKHRPKRIDILIHNQMSYSNGLMSWAPRRMEFFSMPHQNITSADWLTELAIHEYRHVVQADKLNKGDTKWASYLLGQQAVGIILGYSLPMWFIEGDAMVTETTLTQSGRGRSFEFNQELKAQLVERGMFSFDKAYMGSYKEKVPNYYKMGYPLVAMARQQYGTELWEQAVELTGRRNAFSQLNRPLKKMTGKNSKKLYNEQFSKLQEIWIKEVNNQAVTDFINIIHPEKDYEAYQYPKFVNDSLIVCELTGPAIRSQIVEINIRTGGKKTLVYTGIREEEPISANEKMIVWTELKYDTRWENESFSIIRVYDRTLGETTTLGNKTRYFAPAIHPELPLIAVVEGTTDYRFFVTLIDALSGDVIKQIPAPENQFIMTPSWNMTGENLIAVLLNAEGKAIYTLDTEQEKWTQISPHSFDEKCHPVQSGNNVWYAAKGATGQEIYHYNITAKEKTVVTSSKYGAAFPSVTSGSNELYYSLYTDRGYHIVKYEPSNVKPDTVNIGNSFIDRLAHEISLQEELYVTDVSQKEYKVEKYSKFNLINIHSWAPLNINFYEEIISTGVSLMSQNLLGTSIFTAGVNLDQSYRKERFNLNYSYYGFYPVIDANLSFGDEKLEVNGMYTNETDTFTLFANSRIKHLKLEPGINVPFDLSSGNYQRRLIPEIRLNFERRSDYSYEIEYYTGRYKGEDLHLQSTGRKEIVEVEPLSLFGMSYSLFFYNLRRGTSRDVSTRLGQVFQVLYRHSPGGNLKAGSILGIYTRLYFPGFMRHHSVSVDNSYQHRVNGEKSGVIGNYNNYVHWGDVIGSPRGYGSIPNDDLYLLRATYMMPLFNPDFSFGRFAYLKRIRMNLFYDYANARYGLIYSQTGNKVSFDNSYSSFGGEFNIDVHLMRFTLPFSFGYRVSYRTSNSKFSNEFLLSTSFGSFLVNDRKLK